MSLASLAGCTKVGTAGDVGTRHPYTIPHVLRFAAAADIQGLDAFTHTSGYEMYLAQLTGAYLIKTNQDGEGTVPDVASELPTQKNGGISADGKTITYHIRKGLKWSDGQPLDADDVVWTTNQINNPANNIVSRDGWDLITKIDEPDKYTVVYHLKTPYSSYAVTFFSDAGANPAIQPKHKLASFPNLNDAAYASLPVGAGPFMYKEWKRGDHVTMVPNPNYWRGQPKLQQIVFEIIPDRNTVLEEMRSHELDLWIPISPHYYPQALAIPGIVGLSQPSFYFDHLDFNLTHAAFKDPAVREALRLATDRRTVIDKVQNGLYLLDESPITPASKLYHLDLPLVPFDVAKANALLDAAGWKRGADGVRAKDGVRLNLDFATATGSADTDTEIEIFRSAWKQLGVTINVKHYLASLLFAPLAQGGIIYGGKFDIVAFAWGSDTNEDLSNLYACYRFPPDGQNDPRWCDRDATAQMDVAKQSYDSAVRKTALDKVQRAVYAQAPTVVLDARKDLSVFNSDLKWHPHLVSPFDGIMDADI